MDCLDFEVRIERMTNGVYPLVVIKSPAGVPPTGTMSPAFVPEVLRASLRVAGARGAQARAINLNATAPSGDTVQDSVRDLGQQLFAALLSGDIFACYQASLQSARDHGKGLRVRLRIEAPELAALPWEFLFDPKLMRDHLALSRETPVVRQLELSLASTTLALSPPVRVLGMIGHDAGLDVAGEQRKIEDALENLEDTLKVTWVDGHDWRSLSDALDAGDYHVFHFIGHGGFESETGEGFVLLNEEGGTDAAPMSASALARVLGGRRSLKLVVLNSCEGARADATKLLSSTGATLAAQGIPAVVSMQFEISDPAALEFARTFYDSLARGRAVDDAVSTARLAMSMANPESTEWATPVLHMRSDDGRLFEFDIARAVLRDAPATSSLAPPPVVASSRKAREAQQQLIAKVREYWIDGVLAQSMARMDRLKLDVQSDSGAVINLWSGMLDTPEESRRLDDPRTMAKVFEDNGGSLLMLGEPGSGKTVALLELASDLLTRALDDDQLPVPVIFNLSSWGRDASTMLEWITRELSVKYQIPKRASQVWLSERRVLPLLDGLDEVAEERRGACVDALNTMLGGASAVGAVVCCRLKEYLALPNRMALNGAIRLKSLEREEVLALLDRAGDRLAGLRALLMRDQALLQDARTPLMLSLLVNAFDSVPVETIADARGLAVTDRRRIVMQAYVERAFRRVQGGAAVNASLANSPMVKGTAVA